MMDARIAVRDRETEKYYYDVKIPYDVAGLMAEDEKKFHEILLTLNESLNRLDFHIFQKALFPVDIHSNEADYEIQYGNVTRPTHYNTSWDSARFEVCHHKWLDIHENKQEGNKPVVYSTAVPDCENVILEVVKAPEEKEENVQILRLYEYYNQRSELKLTLPEEAERVAVCSMLEEEEQIIEQNTKEVRLPVKPYEIITLKVVYKT